ncbi:putative F-box protein [Senna tora]|uniref:Putative F-box protein n=1 Tax=Senna tora TaxID=362788 RepID=A0A834SQN5_9FABA|nr:putative F-box protein [Senna tora]
MKATSKEFHKICKEYDVYTNASLHKFLVVDWSKPSAEKKAFFQRFMEWMNPGALYREGMLNFFKHIDFKGHGLLCLSIAAESRHHDSMVVFTLIQFSIPIDEINVQSVSNGDPDR